MGNVIWVLFHFGQDVPHSLPVLIFSDVRELGPGEAVVEVVFHLVVLWQAEEVAVLHVQQVLRPHIADIHDGSGTPGSQWVVNAQSAAATRSKGTPGRPGQARGEGPFVISFSTCGIFKFVF